MKHNVHNVNVNTSITLIVYQLIKQPKKYNREKYIYTDRYGNLRYVRDLMYHQGHFKTKKYVFANVKKMITFLKENGYSDKDVNDFFVYPDNQAIFKNINQGIVYNLYFQIENMQGYFFQNTKKRKIYPIKHLYSTKYQKNRN